MNRNMPDDLAALRQRLRDAEPPLDTPLAADLWPRMRERLARTSPARDAGLVPWFDWALVGVAGAAMLLFPALIPALLYHF